jgi:hypothetical protein
VSTHDIKGAQLPFRLAVMGSFPSDSTIDWIKIPLTYPASYALCGSDSCGYLEIRFVNGETAFSLNGILTVDSFPPFSGSFSSDLYVTATGETYFLRNGFFRVF